ncbi:MAG: GspH/FimT family pseudopilin [Desulfomonilia bacterium]
MHTDSGQDYQINKRAGFSLIELMVVVIIIAITAAIAIPNMSGWFGKKNLDSISLQMFSDFQRARSEAITRGRTVTIQINKAGGWYEIHDSTNSQIVPQTTMLKNTTIAKVDGFPLNASNANTSGINSRGFTTTQRGYVMINCTSASGVKNRYIVLNVGGMIQILDSAPW